MKANISRARNLIIGVVGPENSDEAGQDEQAIVGIPWTTSDLLEVMEQAITETQRKPENEVTKRNDDGSANKMPYFFQRFAACLSAVQERKAGEAWAASVFPGSQESEREMGISERAPTTSHDLSSQSYHAPLNDVQDLSHSHSLGLEARCDEEALESIARESSLPQTMTVAVMSGGQPQHRSDEDRAVRQKYARKVRYTLRQALMAVMALRSISIKSIAAGVPCIGTREIGACAPIVYLIHRGRKEHENILALFLSTKNKARRCFGAKWDAIE